MNQIQTQQKIYTSKNIYKSILIPSAYYKKLKNKCL